MILVTGGLGFLGKRLIESLVLAGVKDIRCLVRPRTSSAEGKEILESHPDVSIELFPASFNEIETLRSALDGVDVVIHAAASMSGSFASMVANTVVGSDNLYRACAEGSVKRFVLVSSLGVMDAASVAGQGTVDESVSLEKHPELRDPYSFSKLRQEQLAWSYHDQHGLPLVVVRPGIIFGPGSNLMSPRIGIELFGIFLHLGRRNAIPLTYVDNCADAIVKAALTDGVVGEQFCVVDDRLPRANYLLRRYRREVAPLRVIPVPLWLVRFLSRINVWVSAHTDAQFPVVFARHDINTFWVGHNYSNSKAKRVLGWEPAVSMESALDQTFSTLKQNTAR